MVFNDKTLVMLIDGCEEKAAMILAGRQTIGNRDSALNVVRLTLAAAKENLSRVAPMKKASAAWRRENEFYASLVEKATWAMGVYEGC